MKNIQAVKIGNKINISINGRLLNKECDSNEEAKELYSLILEVRENPTEENIKRIFAELNEATRIAMKCGLETNIDSGEVFLAGFNTPIPKKLSEVIKEYYENNYPIHAIINFWKLLMNNPDVRVRQSAFDFIQTHDFVLTDAGYMVVYKAVYYKDLEKHDQSLAEFVSNKYVYVKKQWNCSPNKYMVYRDLTENALHITKKQTAAEWDVKLRNVEILGNLGEMFKDIDKLITPEDMHYTDMHTRKMDIRLGQLVQMDRKKCDGDPTIECSYGLHVGATKYVEHWGRNNTPILICLVNPAHIVAVANYDHSKMRVSEYFPFAVASYENKKIDVIEQRYFETDYMAYEVEQLNDMTAKIIKNEKPIESAMKSNEETRSMKELLKIVESRMIDINDILADKV